MYKNMMKSKNIRYTYQPGAYVNSKFPLSRSGVDEYLECKKCFYLNRRLGLKKPSQIPFNLNSAVDNLFKNEFDKYRREKREQHKQKSDEELAVQEEESKILKVTEFATASEIATMMDVPSTEIISACMTLGIMVTLNQRLDAETLSIVATNLISPYCLERNADQLGLGSQTRAPEVFPPDPSTKCVVPF